MSSPSSDPKSHQIFLLIAAIAINLLLGVLYCWSLFLVPLEVLLQASRASLSFVSALGLLCFTIGLIGHDAVIRRFRTSLLTAILLLAAALGHLLFWLIPSYGILVFGYGILFGFAAGIGYGLALALARRALTPTRGWAVGLTVAAFAAGGMLFSSLGALLGAPKNIPETFGFIGVVFAISALVLGLLLQKAPSYLGETSSRATTDTNAPLGDFLRLGFSYFSLCYLGLMLVSHGAAILRELGLPEIFITLTPFMLNSGYIIGAVVGGISASHLPSRATPMVFLTVALLAALALSAPLPQGAVVPAVFAIGLGFGSTASAYFMLLVRMLWR